MSEESREPSPALDVIARVVVDAAFEVHKTLGPGFLESVYAEALGIELSCRGLSFARERAVAMHYKGCAIGDARLDFLVQDALVVELKAVDDIAAIHVAQEISYLKATNRPLGLLINFNVRHFRDGIRRIVLSP